MKILNLILACPSSPWKEVETTILNTYYKDRGDIQTYFYYGDSKTDYHNDTHIHLTTPEGLYNVALKTIKAFEYVFSNFDFDMIYRSNISSYIDYNLLKKELETKDTSNIYGGVIGHINSIKFASGCGFVISKNLVHELIKNQHKLNYRHLDDVAIGSYFNNKIEITPMNRFDIDENTQDIDYSHYHYRCKPVHSDYYDFVSNTFNNIYTNKTNI